MTKDEAFASPKDAALKLALITLEGWAIKEALAQPVQPEQDFKTATKEDAPLVKWAKDQTPPLPVQPVQPVQEPSNTRLCRSCNGTGDQDTGIAESPIATCKPCKGTGQIAIAAQPPLPVQPERTWVGLTEVDILAESKHWRNPEDFKNGVYWAAGTLKEKNT